jgi:twitching motility protein PilJ
MASKPPVPGSAGSKPKAPAKPSFFSNLFGSKKPAKPANVSASPASAASMSSTTARMQTVSKTTGPNSEDPGGSKTQKIAAVVANTKVVKPKKVATGFKLPIIGSKPLLSQLKVLGTLAGLFLLLTIIAIALDRRFAGHDSAYTNITSQLQYHTQRLAKSAGLAARGDAGSFPQLQDSRDEFQRYLKVFNEGDKDFPTGSLPSARITESLTSRLTELTKRFDDTSAAATSILAAKNDLTGLNRNIQQVRSGAEELSNLSGDLSGLLQQSNVPLAQVLKIKNMTFLAERLARGSAEIVGSDTIEPDTPFLMGKDTNDFRDLVAAIENGSNTLGISPVKDPDARVKVVKIREQFTEFEKNIKNILDNVQKLTSARQSGRAIVQGSEQLLNNVETLQGDFAETKRTWPLILAIIFGALTLLFASLIGFLFLSDARRRAAEADVENKRNQEAILRLLNEMGDLADGDLTIRAKVTEDITGAIADSMNYTIEELRSLVTGVNNASGQVSAKSMQAQTVSNQLLDAAERQSKEIQDTTQQVLSVADTLSKVSLNAEESSQVAMRSLAASDKGRLAVQNSISGMNEIRDQIQETSKRIKRLGESSQEIGEIVELISDITEQTNVLALNAAIQAASAGEAGRGFSVVAEEVQRLAERSGEATKQIGAIVKTIQADTQDAVAAMEKSTTGVVEGAKLSDAAGQALAEIDTVTKNLASLIQKISQDTQVQAASANRVAANMQDILEINRQTTTGTQQTANSIKDLTEVASDLKASVSGFKL